MFSEFPRAPYWWIEKYRVYTLFINSLRKFNIKGLKYFLEASVILVILIKGMNE